MSLKSKIIENAESLNNESERLGLLVTEQIDGWIDR